MPPQETSQVADRNDPEAQATSRVVEDKRHRRAGYPELVERCRQAGCTRRQQNVVLRLACGETVKRIARKLRISEHAVIASRDVAERKLAEAFPRPETPVQVGMSTVLRCYRNKRLADENPQVVLTEPMASDSLATFPRPRPFGEVLTDWGGRPRESDPYVTLLRVVSDIRQVLPA